MSNFFKYLVILLGISNLIDFFTLLFNPVIIEKHLMFSFHVSKEIMLIYKFLIGVFLLLHAYNLSKKNRYGKKTI